MDYRSRNSGYKSGNQNGHLREEQKMAMSSDTFSVLLKKKRRTGLGFSVKERSIKPCVQVSYIMRGGSAEESDLLRVGDIILSINHIQLSNLDYQDALQCLREIRVNGNALLMVKASSKLVKSLNNRGEVVVAREKFHSNGISGKAYGSKRFRSNENMYRPPSRLEPIYNKSNAKDPMLERPPPNQVVTVDKGISADLVSAEEQSVALSKGNDGATIQNVKPQSAALLQNYETGAKSKETLHLKADPVNICSLNECRGSLMNPPNMTCDPMKDKQSVEELRRLAISFLDQYYDSMKRTGSEAHQTRLNEVLESIKTTGTYELTGNELIFGAKLAWRNAPRCIGRQQWNKLQVFDYRQISTTGEMYQALCSHLKFGTNKGNIRSCITFFPPRRDVSTEFRVWNNQILRYAAYRQDDDSIIGDPVNLEFTQICEKLGWKGKGGRFDVLPWVLQANGQDPEVYDVPEELILEVQIKHPTYKCFEEMDLKWYAVPGVSNIMLNIGGIEFSAAPFNGWFMGTEIGRDLCDVSRYDLLPQIAEAMGLDTKRTSSLWKDTALLEMNVAILHSFQSQNITIMDHHVASESFMKHFHNELKVRGGCPADWVWLVPPISGSACPVFHQEFFNYVINPACLYQPNPWRYYKYKDQKKLKSKRKIHFKELAKSVLLTSNMMTKAMSKRIRATILYATETGKSYEFAKMLKQLFDHAFDGKVVAMEDFDIQSLEYESLVLVVTSTFGNGDPPENGEGFAKNLQKMSVEYMESINGVKQRQRNSKFQSVVTAKPVVKRGSTLNLTNAQAATTASVGHLANVRRPMDEAPSKHSFRFSVFGLGSRAYPHFCAFAHAVDTLLGELGAERLLEIGEGDELSGQAESFRGWSKNVFKAACQEFCVESSNSFFADMDMSDAKYEDSKHRIKTASTIGLEDYVGALSKLHRKNLAPCKLIKRSNLQAEKSGRQTILVELDTENSDVMKYQPGDHLGVYPQNNEKLVRDLMACLGDIPDDQTLIEVESMKIKKTQVSEIKTWEAVTRLPPCSLYVALSRYLDICTPPSQRLLEIYAEVASDPSDREKLLKLSQDSAAYDEWSLVNVPNLVEVIKEFPSLRLSIPLLFTQLPLLQVRYYSISSSHDVHPGEVHATVAVVQYRTHGGRGALHEGVCSNYLNRIDSDEIIPCFVRAAPSFHLPPDDKVPCILIGPGTGIAPFRSFWEQRSHDKIKGSTMALLFGCRHSEQDHIYKEEVQDCLKQGSISHAYTAYSRDPDHKKKYVQDIIKQDISDFVVENIVKRNGHFYVCGDVKMANGVNEALKAVLQARCSMSQEDAEEYVTKMKVDERYHEDIFGITLRTFEVQQTVRENTRRNSAMSRMSVESESMKIVVSGADDVME